MEPRPETLTMTDQEVTSRVLLAHTIKDGWRCAETSVTITGPHSGADLRVALARAYEAGRFEVERRQREDAEAAEEAQAAA